ncbi:MAG TPA: discoidin domain-containing protein, partial [Chloroflexia bacterium]
MTIDLDVTPRIVAVGDLFTVTLTVHNQAPHPASNLAVTMPLPAGVVAQGISQTDGWNWQAARLDGDGSTTMSALMRLVQTPPGDAVLVRVEATAQGLSVPVTGIGGALVVRRGLGVATKPYVPGVGATLRSPDGRIEIKIPPGATDRPLTLQHSYDPGPKDKVSTEIMGFKRGFPPFYLNATDAQGREFHQFSQPLTITINYTPQQLQVLGFTEEYLSVFWADESRPSGSRWVPLPTNVDAESHTVTAFVDHFTEVGLGEDFRPSEKFIPSLKEWQVGLYRGDTTFDYDIEVPAGPAGIKPEVKLGYNSSATDGPGGLNAKQQSSWAGKGWNLETGYIAHNKLSFGQATDPGHYSLVLNGQTYDLMRAEALVPSPTLTDPTHYAWRTTNESFNRIRVITNGASTLQRGGYVDGQPLPRHKWQVWTKDGMRYDFEEDAWWGFSNCPFDTGPTPADPYSEMQAYKWHLSKVEDTHGNIITYTYGRKTAIVSRDPKNENPCGVPVTGVSDYDVWPKEITWGGALGAGNGASPRYKVSFVSVDRTIDTEADQPANQFGPQSVKETQQLEEVLVYSNQSSPYSATAWDLVSRHDLIFQGGTDWQNYLLSDGSTCNADNTVCSPITTTLKLTLKEIRQFGSNNSTYLPPMSFTYGLTRGTSLYPQGAWNRLTKADNNQGGVATFEYETIASVFPGQPAYAKHYKNNRRVTRRLFEDGRGNTYTWSYEYKDPAYNSLGTALTTSGSTVESGPNTYPTSATVYYNEKREPGNLDTNRPLLVHKRNTEFRGHSYVKETDPNGNQTEHWFYQGNLGTQGDQGCYPKDASNNPLTGDAILTESTCFMPMRDREFLKGKEWKTIRHQGTAGTNINLAQGKAATQSSTDYSGTANRAVDGNTSGNYNNGSVTHTLLESQTWWQVDLGAIQSIGNIDLWNRTDCCTDRLSNFDVFVSDVPFVSTNINETRNQAGVSSYYTPGIVGTSIRLAVNRTGRYVRVQLRGTNCLSLAEVQVWSGTTALSETQHEFTVNFYEYGDTTKEKLTGLWRAFAFENRTTENAWELGTTALARKTEFVYDIANNPHYGNLLSTKEYNEAGTVTRETVYAYKVLNSATSYIVDRKRSEDIKDGSGNRVARTVFAYDGSNGGNESLTKGDLTLVRKYHNMPSTLPATPATIESSDTSFGYDTAGNKTTSTTYAAYGTALTNDTGWSTPGNGSTATTKTTQYDPVFNVYAVAVTEGITSLVEQRGYDLRMGTQTSETDYNGVQTLARYDVFGRITAVIKPGDTVNLPTASADYHDWERPVRYIMGEREISGNEPYWRPTITLYDGLGREIQNKEESIDGLEHIVDDKRYDGLGQVIEESQLHYVSTSGTFWEFVPPTNPLYRPTRTTYDGLGRKTQVQEPGPTATTPITTLTQHSVSGNRKVVTTTDPNRHIMKHESDALGRLLAVKEYSGDAGTEGAYTLYSTTSYDYSPLDLLKEVTDTKGKKITMQYDTLGRKKAMTDLAMGAWTYTYDPNGNLKTQIDAKNQTITFGYDAMDRLTSKTYPGATTPERTAYTYDVGTYGKGRRTKMERFAATSGTLLASTAWQYDARGRKIRADHTVDGLADARRFDWTYDAADRITSITYPLVPTLNSREVVSYGYDAGWRSVSLCSNLYSPCYVTNTKYSPLDQPQEVRLGNNLWNAYIYNDPTQRLQQIKVGPNGDGSIFNRTYTYDDASNVKSIARNDGGATETQNFTYDHRDRLKTWIIPGAQQVVDETYTYDEVGNLLTKTKKKNANQSDTYTYIYNYNRTAGAGGPYGVLDVQLNGGNNTDYTYDANGNLSVTDGPDPGERRNYTWNADNQPTLITRQGGGCGVTETYVYDADGERVKQSRGNTENTYDLEGMWWEKRHSNGAIVIREMYKFNGQVVAQREVQPNRNVPANGLRADYYNNANETNFQLSKYDGQISFNWGTGSPDPTVSCDRFSIVWNGNVTPSETSTYTFKTRSDDG